MKITLEANVLLNAIRDVRLAIDGVQTLPILNNLLLRAEGSSLSVTATNLDLMITKTVAAMVSQEGTTTVNAKVLHKIVKCLPPEIVISLDDGKLDGEIRLHAGSTLVMLPTLPHKDFQIIAAKEFKTSFTIPARDLWELLDRAAFAMSIEEIRYYLNGIFLHVIEQDGKTLLRAVATDGHRLARVDTGAPSDAVGMPGVIVPSGTVHALRKLSTEGDVRIEISSERFRFTLDGGITVIIAKPVDDIYPDYSKVIPNGECGTIRIARDQFLTALDRFNAVAETDLPAIKLVAASGSVSLSVRYAERGTAIKQVAADISAPIEIGFNAGYIRDILRVCNGETVVMTFTDSASPVTFKGSGDSSALYVLMPMRI